MTSTSWPSKEFDNTVSCWAPLADAVEIIADNRPGDLEYLRFKTKLPPALLEFAIIITARRWSAHYEWFAHEKLARSAGLEPAIIDAIAAGREPESMSDDQRIVHSFVTQVHRRGTPDDAAFVAARDRFGLAGTLDLLGLCGYYSIVAMVLNTAQIMPEGAPPLAPLDRNYP